MYKTVLLALALLSANAVTANEVDARNPQKEVPTPLALAVADTGISNDSWTLGSTRRVISKHDDKTLNALNDMNEELNQKIRKSLTHKLELKFIQILN